MVPVVTDLIKTHPSYTSMDDGPPKNVGSDHHEWWTHWLTIIRIYIWIDLKDKTAAAKNQTNSWWIKAVCWNTTDSLRLATAARPTTYEVVVRLLYLGLYAEHITFMVQYHEPSQLTTTVQTIPGYQRILYEVRKWIPSDKLEDFGLPQKQKPLRMSFIRCIEKGIDEVLDSDSIAKQVNPADVEAPGRCVIGRHCIWYHCWQCNDWSLSPECSEGSLPGLSSNECNKDSTWCPTMPHSRESVFDLKFVA